MVFSMNIPGTFVKGRVLSVDGARLELTLRSNVSSGEARAMTT